MLASLVAGRKILKNLKGLQIIYLFGAPAWHAGAAPGSELAQLLLDDFEAAGSVMPVSVSL